VRTIDNEAKIRHINEIIILTITIYIVLSTASVSLMQNIFQKPTLNYTDGVPDPDPNYEKVTADIQLSSQLFTFYYLLSMCFFILYYVALKAVTIFFPSFSQFKHLNIQLFLLLINMLLLAILVVFIFFKGRSDELFADNWLMFIIIGNILIPFLCFILLLWDLFVYCFKYIISVF
jgi:hypothetical protein